MRVAIYKPTGELTKLRQDLLDAQTCADNLGGSPSDYEIIEIAKEQVSAVKSADMSKSTYVDGKWTFVPYVAPPKEPTAEELRQAKLDEIASWYTEKKEAIEAAVAKVDSIEVTPKAP